MAKERNYEAEIKALNKQRVDADRELQAARKSVAELNKQLQELEAERVESLASAPPRAAETNGDDRARSGRDGRAKGAVVTAKGGR
jgi:hypothetical protein